MGRQSAEERRSDCGAFLDQLFGLRKGLIALVTIEPGHGARRGRLVEAFVPWPDEREAVLDGLIDEAAAADVYLSPALRDSDSRKREAAVPGPWLWADVDTDVEADSYAHEALLQLLVSRGGMLVRSGTQGHVHVYVRLQRVVRSLEALEQLNRRLMLSLQGDSKWDASSILRVPGSLNHKTTPARPVTLETTPGARTDGWSLDELDALLVPFEIAAAERWTGVPSPGSLKPECFELDSLPADVRAQLDQEITPGSRRSRQTFALVLACLERGLTAGQCLFALMHHEPSRDKFGRRGRSPQEGLAEQVLAIYDKHPHPGARCFAVGCPNSPEVDAWAQRARELYVELMASPWPLATRNKRDVLGALLLEAASRRRPVIAISQRDLAVLGGMSDPTLRKWLAELLEEGAVVLCGVPRRGHAQRYRVSLDRVDALIPRRGRVEANLPAPPRRGMSAEALSAIRDLSRPGCWRDGRGLGKTRVDVFFLLTTAKLTVVEIADHLPCDPKTARLAIRELAEFGGVVQFGDRWAAADEVDWVGVARQRGVLGRVAAQLQRHTRERAAFREHLDEEAERDALMARRFRDWVVKGAARRAGLDEVDSES